jgi:hypothetical protein
MINLGKVSEVTKGVLPVNTPDDATLQFIG